MLPVQQLLRPALSKSQNHSNGFSWALPQQPMYTLIRTSLIPLLSEIGLMQAHPPQFPQHPYQSFHHLLRKKNNSELLQFDRQSASDRTFICDASISDITTEEGWFKTECTVGTCTLTAYLRDGFWTCPAHWRITACRYMYHINAVIMDSTGSGNAVIYNNADEAIVGSPCSDLITADTIRSPKTLPAAVMQTKGKVFRLYLKVQLYTKIGATGFNINRAEHTGDTSGPQTTQPPFGRGPTGADGSLPPQTPTPARQPHRQATTTSVKRSLPSETGSNLPCL